MVLDTLRSQVSRVQAEEECKRKADAEQDEKRTRIVEEIKTNKLASGAAGAIAIAGDDAPRKKKASVDDCDARCVMAVSARARTRSHVALLLHCLLSLLCLFAARASWLACSAADDNRGALLRSCSLIACSHAALLQHCHLALLLSFCTLASLCILPYTLFMHFLFSASASPLSPLS